jgi:DNA-binding Lrp family transcriptional regulator
MITAIVLIHADNGRIPETAQAVADTEGVAEVYSCAGDVDLIAIVRVRTTTHIAFKSYSRAEVEAAFSLGD